MAADILFAFDAADKDDARWIARILAYRQGRASGVPLDLVQNQATSFTSRKRKRRNGRRLRFRLVKMVVGSCTSEARQEGQGRPHLRHSTGKRDICRPGIFGGPSRRLFGHGLDAEEGCGET